MISVNDMPNNLLKNNKFDNSMNNWNTVGTTGNDHIKVIENNNVFKFNGGANNRKYIYQSINIEGKKGDIFSFAGWYKTDAVPINGEKSVRVTINVIGKNNEDNWVDIVCNPDSNEWQFLSDEFITKHDYKRIDVYLICYHNANDTLFDNVGLFKEEYGQSFKYDDKGNLVNSRDLSKTNSEFKYNGNNNLINAVSPKGANYEYEYDFNKKNNLSKATNSSGQSYNFEYDNFGNATQTKIEESFKIDEPENNNTYKMRVANSNRFFDIDGIYTTNGANLKEFAITDGNNQRFKLVDAGGGYFSIVPSHATNMAIDLDIASGNIQQWSNGKSDNQLWKFIKNDDGTYRVINKEKGEEYCMALEGDNENGKQNIAIEKWEGKESQKIAIYNTKKEGEVQDNYLLEAGEVYYIKLNHSNLYLEQQSDSQSSGIVQNEYKEKDPNQLWRVERIENGTYKLINLGSKNGNAIDVSGGNNSENQKIQMYGYNNPNKAQEWRIIRNQDNTHGMISSIAGTERFLAISGASKDKGANTVLQAYNGQDNQKIIFEKANLSDVEDGATYKIKAKHSNLYLTSKNGAVFQENKSTSTDQEWVLKNLKNGYYKICLKTNENIVFDVQNYVNSNNTDLYVSTQTGDMPRDSQQFEIHPNTDGTYKIAPKILRGKYSLDVHGVYKTPGAKLTIFESLEAENQKFYLEKTNGSNSKQYIQTNAEYTNDGRYQTKLIDQEGKETNYEYNENLGIVTKTIDSNQKQTIYTHDNLNRVTKIEKQAGNILYSNEYTYQNDRINTIKQNGFIYSFIYDGFGNQKQVKVGNQTLITNEYEERNGNLKSATYGNNQKVSYEYDRFDRLTKKTGTNGSYSYTYDAKSNLAKITDQVNNETESYTYDLGERPVKIENTNGYKVEYEYDKSSNINSIKNTLNDTNNVIKYNYDRDNKPTSIKVDEDKLLTYNYDNLSRLKNQQIKANGKTYKTEYKYKNTNETNKTTTIVESIKNGNNEEIKYTYDNIGNIETITKGTTRLSKYYYDELSQLIREDNKELNKTITYEYDAGGNIQNRKEYAYTEGTLPGTTQKTTEYKYTNTNWKDQLTSYDNKQITYDEIGNPTNYDGNTYTWQNGRQLAKIQKGNETSTYKYNDSGIRTEKTVNGTTIKYYLNGSKVIYEKTGNETIYYTYDSQGEIIGLKYNNSQYYYIKNAQNDVIGLLDKDLNQVVSYTYDSWGALISVKDKNGNNITDTNNIGLKNPYRYRGYRYDNETGLYYLQSRYYNSNWGRFINSDGIGGANRDLLSHNLYAYVSNSPINNYDPTGKFIQSIINFISSIFDYSINSVMQSAPASAPKIVNPIKSTATTAQKTTNQGIINIAANSKVSYSVGVSGGKGPVSAGVSYGGTVAPNSGINKKNITAEIGASYNKGLSISPTASFSFESGIKNPFDILKNGKYGSFTSNNGWSGIISYGAGIYHNPLEPFGVSLSGDAGINGGISYVWEWDEK